MLRIFFGDMPEANYGPSWFQFNYEPKWFQDPFIQQMIAEIDQSKYIDGLVINSPVLGAIPPEKLSGGVQTLIMIYEKSDLIFDATACGDNCAAYLLKIGKVKDVTVNLNYLMSFKEYEPFEIMILNENKIVTTAKDYIMTAVKYV